MILVLDASVAIKWFFRDEPNEQHAQRALQILQAVGAGEVRLVQPPHFMAEVSAVLARENPEQVQTDIVDLLNVGWRVSESAEIYGIASELAASLNHHLFDTLYHAVALHEPDALLVTADVRYYNKAGKAGRITLLEDFLLGGVS
ncbi:MAG: type II toxin-antitoxin system VapC family toxin [Sideroxydans sp.]